MGRALIALVLLALFLIGCSKNNEVTGNIVATGEQAQTGVCKDSDGGINTNIKGIVTVGDTRYYDTCLTGLLLEYYCDGDKVSNQNIRCTNECYGGKCI